MPLQPVPLVRRPGLSPVLQALSAGLDPAVTGAVTVIPRVRLQKKASPPQVPSVRHHGHRPALPVLSAGLTPTGPTTVANTLRIGTTLTARPTRTETGRHRPKLRQRGAGMCTRGHGTTRGTAGG